MLSRILMLQIGLFLSTAIAFAQPWSMHIYDSERGLPSEITKDITKDSLGFVWVASDEGLSCFDGVTFKSFRKELSSIFTKKFLKLSDGTLLLATDFGIDKIDSRSDTTIITPYIKGGAYASDSTIAYPKDLYETRDNSLWIAELRHIVRYKDGAFKRYFISEKDISTSFTKSFSFQEDELGVLWVTSYAGRLFYYDITDDRFINIPLSQEIKNVTKLMYLGDSQWLVGSYSGLFRVTVDKDRQQGAAERVGTIEWIKSISVSADGMLYVGTRNNGLYRANWSLFLQGDYRFEEVKGLEQSAVNAVYTDSQRGSCWIASNKGIAFLEKRVFQNMFLGGEKSNIHAVAYWKYNHTVVAEGRYVYLLSYEKKHWKEKLLWSYDGNYVMSLAIHNDFLWMGMSSGALYRIDLVTQQFKKFLFGNEDGINAHINALHISENGHAIWASKQNTKGIYKLSLGKDFSKYKVLHYDSLFGFTNAVSVIKENSRGDVFLGSESDSAYLFLYKSSSKEIQNIGHAMPIECGESFEVFDMAIQDDSIVSLGTSCGVWRLNTENGSFAERLYDSKHQSHEWQIKAMLFDYSGRLWLATRQGLVLHNSSEQVLFNEAGGLASKTITHRGLLLDKQKNLWVATAKGLSWVDLKNMRLVPTSAPILTEVSINDRKIPSKATKTIAFSGQSYLSIAYAPAIYPGEDVHYQTRIVGHDSTWSAFTKMTSQMMRPLPAGSYTFQVRSQHLNGYYWSEPTSLHFTVEKSWYTRSWALLVVSILLYTLVAGAVRWNTWRLIRAKKKLAKAVRERMAESIEQNKMLSQQKEEITKQSEYIQERNQQLETAQRLIETQNHQLTEANHLLEEKIEARTKALKNTMQDLEKSNHELDFFIYRAAHDLRGPIARVSGLASLLKQLSDDKAVQDCVKHLNTTAVNMEQTLHRLLQTLEIKSTKPSWQTLSLEELVNTTLSPFIAMGIIDSERVQYKNRPWPYVKTDADLFIRMLNNLVQNAIDFQNPYAKLALTLDIKEAGDYAFLYLSDNGKGIVEEAQKHIFELFYIGNEHSTGAGLGLYEVNTIAQKLLGEVKLHSSSQGATIFEIKLPVG